MLIVTIMLLTLTLAITPLVEAGGNKDFSVLPINARPHGKSYGEWAARWWQWALETPTNNHPILDATGEQCAVAQTGKVWFLGGTFEMNTPVTRHCAIPNGTALFFPLLNAGSFAFLNDPPEQRVESYLRTQIVCSVPTDLAVIIDGVPVHDPLQYLEKSPLFDVHLPMDNVFGLDETVIPQMLLSPSVDRGYYLFLAPLSQGQHTIHWGGSWTCPFGSSAQDVTYNLTVGRERD